MNYCLSKQNLFKRWKRSTKLRAPSFCANSVRVLLLCLVGVTHPGEVHLFVWWGSPFQVRSVDLMWHDSLFYSRTYLDYKSACVLEIVLSLQSLKINAAFERPLFGSLCINELCFVQLSLKINQGMYLKAVMYCALNTQMYSFEWRTEYAQYSVYIPRCEEDHWVRSNFPPAQSLSAPGW